MPTSAYHDPLVGSTEWRLIYLKCSISFDWFYLPLWNWRLLFFYFRLICRQIHSERMSTQSEWKFGCMVNWMPWKTLQPSNQSALTDSQRQLWQFPSKFVTDQFHAGIQSKVNQQLMKTWFDRRFSKSWDFGRFTSHSNVSDVSDCKKSWKRFPLSSSIWNHRPAAYCLCYQNPYPWLPDEYSFHRLENDWTQSVVVNNALASKIKKWLKPVAHLNIQDFINGGSSLPIINTNFHPWSGRRRKRALQLQILIFQYFLFNWWFCLSFSQSAFECGVLLQ